MTPHPRPRLNSGWMLTFADLLGLLLCFFVLIYSTRDMSSADWSQVRDTMGSRFEGSGQALSTPEQPVADEGLYLETWLRARLAEQPQLSGLLVERNDRGIGLRLASSMELTQKGANTLVAILERLDNRLMLTLPAGTVDQLTDAAEKARMFRAALGAAGLKRPVAIILDPAISDTTLIVELARQGDTP